MSFMTEIWSGRTHSYSLSVLLQDSLMMMHNLIQNKFFLETKQFGITCTFYFVFLLYSYLSIQIKRLNVSTLTNRLNGSFMMRIVVCYELKKERNEGKKLKEWREMIKRNEQIAMGDVRLLHSTKKGFLDTHLTFLAPRSRCRDQRSI